MNNLEDRSDLNSPEFLIALRTRQPRECEILVHTEYVNQNYKVRLQKETLLSAARVYSRPEK